VTAGDDYEAACGRVTRAQRDLLDACVSVGFRCSALEALAEYATGPFRPATEDLVAVKRFLETYGEAAE
jgi:hypothetical protein